MKHCFVTRIIFLLYLTVQFLYAENISVSSEPVTSQDEIQTPMFFKFYYLPDYFNPSLSIDYDDIVSSYKYNISPQVKKIGLSETIFSTQQQEKNKFNLYLGENIAVFLTTKNVFENKNMSFDLQFDKFRVLYFDEPKKQIVFCTSFMYTQIVDSFVFINKIKTYSDYLTNVYNQYSIDIDVNKILFNNLGLSFVPQIMWYNNEVCDKLFLINKVGIDFLLNKKNVGFSIEGRYLDLDRTENFIATVKTLIRDVIVDGNTATVSYSLDKNDNLYYELKFGQKTKKLEITFVGKKEFYYEYINNYFISFPKIEVDNTTNLYFPTIEGYSIESNYRNKNFAFSLFFDKYLYTKYPGFVFENNNVVPILLDNQEVCSLRLKSKISFIDFEVKYLLSGEIYFCPKLVSQICVNKEFFGNIYFLIKLLYNTKTKVAKDRYIDQNFISEWKIRYKLKERFDIELFVSQPIMNKYVVQPEIILNPYVQIGISLQF